MSGGRERGLKKGTSEGGRGDGKGQGRSLGGSETGRDGNFKGGTLMRALASIQYIEHKTTHNAVLAIATLVLQN